MLRDGFAQFFRVNPEPHKNVVRDTVPEREQTEKHVFRAYIVVVVLRGFACGVAHCIFGSFGEIVVVIHRGFI